MSVEIPISNHVSTFHQDGKRCTRLTSISKIVSYLLVVSLLSIISIEILSPSGDSGGEFMRQWNYLAMGGLVFICCLLVYASFSWCMKIHMSISYSFLWTTLKWGIIILTGTECLWGMAQLYHLLPSFNPYFNLTGSFFNPAPFSAYLILGLPICLNEYILLRKKESICRFFK